MPRGKIKGQPAPEKRHPSPFSFLILSSRPVFVDHKTNGDLNTIALIKEGNEAAFEEVYRDFYNKLYFFVLGKTRSDYLAEETVQITFIKLWQRRASLNENIPLAAQVFQIARTSLIDLIRKQNNFIAALQQVREQPVSGSRWDELNLKELNGQFNKGLAGMPPVRKQIFTLSRVEGLSNKEIAGRLSVSVKTVEKHITLAIKQLRPLLTGLISLLYIIFYRE